MRIALLVLVMTGLSACVDDDRLQFGSACYVQVEQVMALESPVVQEEEVLEAAPTLFDQVVDDTAAIEGFECDALSDVATAHTGDWNGEFYMIHDDVPYMIKVNRYVH